MKRTWLVGISLMVMLVFSLGLVAQADDKDMNSANKDIVDTAMGDRDSSTLCTAVKKADLIQTLKSKGPFTVFVPNNEAFAKLPPGQLDALLANKGKLKEVLLFHVVPGKVMASDVASLKSMKSASGKDLTVSTDGDDIMVGNARVIKGDIECKNGVIHVIDTVLTP